MTIIIEFIGPLLIALITGCFFFCGIAAIASVRVSGNISRDEESGAPEGGYQPKIN